MSKSRTGHKEAVWDPQTDSDPRRTIDGYQLKCDHNFTIVDCLQKSTDSDQDNDQCGPHFPIEKNNDIQVARKTDSETKFANYTAQ